MRCINRDLGVRRFDYNQCQPSDFGTALLAKAFTSDFFFLADLGQLT